MNDTLIKCTCGKEIEKYSTKYITSPLNPEFVCRECWQADKESKKAEVQVCCRCDKVLKGKDFIDHRFCLAPDKDGIYRWKLLCTECEPYIEMGEKH